MVFLNLSLGCITQASVLFQLQFLRFQTQKVATLSHFLEKEIIRPPSWPSHSRGWLPLCSLLNDSFSLIVPAAVVSSPVAPSLLVSSFQIPRSFSQNLRKKPLCSRSQKTTRAALITSYDLILLGKWDFRLFFAVKQKIIWIKRGESN